MSNPSKPPREDARKKAQSHFEVADQRTALVKQIVESESAARDAKTAKLRALRLAKEEADGAAVIVAPKPRATRKRSS